MGPVIRQLVNSSAFKQILHLSVSRLVGQGALFASTLLCARFYGPDSFGIAGLVTSLMTLTAMVISLRFESLAIVAKSHLARDAYIGLAYFSSIIFVCIIYVFIFVFDRVYASVDYIYYTIPIGAFLITLIQFILPAQSANGYHFKSVSWATQASAVATALMQVAFGLTHPTSSSLVLSRIVGPAIGLTVASRLIADGLFGARKLTLANTRRLSKLATKEILYGIPASLLSVISFQSPIYIFSITNRTGHAGQYWMAFNIVFVPYMIISASIRPIFLRSVASDRSATRVVQIVNRATGIAALVGLAVFCVAVLASIEAQQFLSDSGWSAVPLYASSLSLLMVGLIIQTPISAASSTLNLQAANFWQNLIHTLVRPTAFYLTIIFSGSDLYGVSAFSISGLIICLVYTYHSLRTLSIRAGGTPGTIGK